MPHSAASSPARRPPNPLPHFVSDPLAPVDPVLPGCHPDPSICRVGEDYYLVTSSFAYFPAVPIHHSRNLLDWELIGHVVTDPAYLRTGDVDFASTDIGDGVWAPTIRHHDGVFYVVFALARERRGCSTLLFTASDPRGPWSGPVELEADGIDPSLFFDDDGSCWFAAARDATVSTASGPAEIYLRRLDLATLSLVGPTTIVWHGALTGAWAEAPHLVKRDGVYHLLAAEGGTESRHSVTAAQADAVTGPWRTDPRSPLLTHRHLSPDHPVQNVGHADLVDDPEGRTWAVVLGVRPHEGTHTLGREVFLVPVEWSAQGPVFAPGTGMVTALVPPSALSSLGLSVPVAASSGLQGPERWVDLDPASAAMSSLRGPVPGLRGAASGLRGTVTGGPAVTVLGTPSQPRGSVLPVSPLTLSTVSGTPSFTGWAQRDLHFRAELWSSALPTDGVSSCGLALVNTAEAWVAVVVTVAEDGTPQVSLVGPAVSEDAHAPQALTLPSPVPSVRREAGVVFAVEGDGDAYRFSVNASTGEADTSAPGTGDLVGSRGWHFVGSVPRERLSTEVAGGFLGVHLGPYASSHGVVSEALFRVDLLRYRSTGFQAAGRPGSVAGATAAVPALAPTGAFSSATSGSPGSSDRRGDRHWGARRWGEGGAALSFDQGGDDEPVGGGATGEHE